MSTSISGNDVTIYKRTATGPDVYKVLTCATDVSLSSTKDTVQSKTKCGTKTTAGTSSWEMSFSGDIDLAPASDQVSFDTLYADHTAGTKIHVAFMDVAGTSVKFDGDAIITKFDVSSPVDANVTFSMTLSGDGDLTLS